MNQIYQLGLLILVFGGFLALIGTGLFASIGITSIFIGFLIGLVGIIESSLSN